MSITRLWPKNRSIWNPDRCSWYKYWTNTDPSSMYFVFILSWLMHFQIFRANILFQLSKMSKIKSVGDVVISQKKLKKYLQGKKQISSSFYKKKLSLRDALSSPLKWFFFRPTPTKKLFDQFFVKIDFYCYIQPWWLRG